MTSFHESLLSSLKQDKSLGFLFTERDFLKAMLWFPKIDLDENYVTATRHGTALTKEQFLMSVIFLRFKYAVCENCSATKRLRVCGLCCLVFFCSPACHKAVLGAHKTRCMKLEASREEGPLRFTFMKLLETKESKDVAPKQPAANVARKQPAVTKHSKRRNRRQLGQRL